MRTLSTGLDATFDPALAPKGGLIAFAARESEAAPSHIFVRGLAPTAQPLAVAGPETEDTSPAWSASGDKLAFVRHRVGEPCQVVVKDAPAGAETAAGDRATEERTRLAWAPGGDALYYVDRPRAAQHGYFDQDHSLAAALQPPPARADQARPRTIRPVGAPVGWPSRRAKRPLTSTWSTPVASRAGLS